MEFVIIILLGIIWGIFTSFLAKKKGYSQVTWFILGLFFNLIALLVIVGLPSKIKNNTVPNAGDSKGDEFEVFDLSELSNRSIDLMKKCPDCGEMIRIDARICRYCKRKFTDEELISTFKDALNKRTVKDNKILYFQILDALAKLGDTESMEKLREEELKFKKFQRFRELALKELKKISGGDAKNFAQDLQNGWICICGEENDKSSANCRKCHRSRDFVLKNYTEKAMINLILSQQSA